MNRTSENAGPAPATHTGKSWAKVYFALACLVTFVAAFYAIENWRGKRAWQKHRLEVESRGISLNWDDYIPPKVPEDQNAFKASKMQEWFVKAGPFTNANVPDKSFTPLAAGSIAEYSRRLHGEQTNITVAEVKIVDRDHTAAGGSGDTLRLEDPASRKAAPRALESAVGPHLDGAQGMLFVARPFEQIAPAKIVLEADKPVTAKELSALFFSQPDIPGNGFRILSNGTNSFRIVYEYQTYIAADYLAWTDPREADFDQMREALKRPYARMEGDYDQPASVPIPNFVRLRTVAQMLSQRAQCNLLLGRPEAAFHDLTLVHQLCILLEARPTGKPMTLVAGMINVAIRGLYTYVVADGLRLKAWQEPQLVAIEQQLKETDLFPIVTAAFRCEEVSGSRRFETSRDEMASMVVFGPKQPTFWEKVMSPKYILLSLVPRGWAYQNMASMTFIDQNWVQALQDTNKVLDPVLVDQLGVELQNRFGRFSPYTYLAAMAVPNFQKATQVLARNQTLVNEGMVACALERYRIANGDYPESLEALIPGFLEKVPHDLIGGKPLKYHAADGNYALYSVGWDAADNGGVSGKSYTEGDWVWGTTR